MELISCLIPYIYHISEKRRITPSQGGSWYYYTVKLSSSVVEYF